MKGPRRRPVVTSLLLLFLLQSQAGLLFALKSNHPSPLSSTTSMDPRSHNSHNHKSHGKRLKMSALEEHDHNYGKLIPGRLEALKQQEAELAAQLAAIRSEKLSALRSRPLTIGIVGFGRFGQFIAHTFAQHATVIASSRSDYTELAHGLGVQYVSLSHPEEFLQHDLDVIVFAVSIMSFRSTLERFAPVIAADLERRKQQASTDAPVLGPLIVDVLSVKEHARNVMLELLPPECDILCTHPMFGPDSGKNSWRDLNFVYEKTRIDQVVLESASSSATTLKDATTTELVEESQGYVEGNDRMERFLSIWEEEGCRMVPMSCKEHDEHAANSQFVTHLVGRVLGNQGLVQTPIDTSGFQSVLKLVGSTTADSFELFYGLYKYNENSLDTIRNLQDAMNDVVDRLNAKELEEQMVSQAESNPAAALSSADKPVAVCTPSPEPHTGKRKAA